MTPLFDIPAFELIPVETNPIQTLPTQLHNQGILMVMRLPESTEFDEIATAILPDDSRLRVQAIRQINRRRQSLWARMMLCTMALKTRSYFYEHPPYGPRMAPTKSQPLYVSIGHTKEYAVACLCAQPVGIDVEMCRKIRDPQGLCNYAFPQEIAQYTIEQTGGEDDFPEILPFFGIWGMRRAAIKLNAPYGEYQLALREHKRYGHFPVILEGVTGQALYPRFYVVGHGHWGGLCQGYEDNDADNPAEEYPTLITAVTNASLIHIETTAHDVMNFLLHQAPKAYTRARTILDSDVLDAPLAPAWRWIRKMPTEWQIPADM